MKRKSGILMPISSLPGEFGIGTLGKKAYEFVDFIKKCGFEYWQILPLGHTGYGNSPYQCFSAFAGNPYFIDFDILKDEGLLEEDEFTYEYYGNSRRYIDYTAVFQSRYKLLRMAYNRFKKFLYENKDMEYEDFLYENSFWIDEYAFYMSLKGYFGLKSWYEWDNDIKERQPSAVKRYRNTLENEIGYWKFIQYIFFKQWYKLKKYANSKGINIIGDIPIYVASDSADTWNRPEDFKIDLKNMQPIAVSGCPPDAFSKDGQLWGNVVYDWQHMKLNGYRWWIHRMQQNTGMYDVIRIDHFRGFESYWEVAYGSKTAANGRWIKGPGIELFQAIKKSIGNINIIAEDLGFLTDEVSDFLKKTGFPGMKVLQFAFDGNPNNKYLPHMYDEKCVAYTGTHDNDTCIGWCKKSGIKDEVKNASLYLGINEKEGINWGFLRGIWCSPAELTIAPLQDFIGSGSESRMNIPSTLENNWRWRAYDEDFDESLMKKIRNLNYRYGRCEEDGRDKQK